METISTTTDSTARSARAIDHVLPRCVDCGHVRGPWVPTGEYDDRGAQVFRCAPGHGCTDRDARAEAAAQARAQAEIDQARAEFDPIAAQCAACAAGFDGAEIYHGHIGPVSLTVEADGQLVVCGVPISLPDADAVSSWLAQYARGCRSGAFL